MRVARKFLVPMVTVAVSCGLSACDTNKQPLAHNFGEAVSRDMAAEIVNPVPPSAQNSPEMSGRRDALAIDRYETGKVKNVEVESTTKLVTSGTGGSAK